MDALYILKTMDMSENTQKQFLFNCMKNFLERSKHLPLKHEHEFILYNGVYICKTCGETDKNIVAVVEPHYGEEGEVDMRHYERVVIEGVLGTHIRGGRGVRAADLQRMVRLQQQVMS